MEIPVIDFSELNGEKRSQTMALLHHACEKWGFFMIENHGVETRLMNKVKALVNDHYEKNMKDNFYESDIVKNLDHPTYAENNDWESAFFISHRPNSNIHTVGNLPTHFEKTMDEYIDQLIKVAEKLAELMCENLGLEKNYIKNTFSGIKGPSVGTKVAIYPSCPEPKQVLGLREHTDAGGIILLLQDDQVPGLEFYKDGKWVKIPPSKNNRIFINTGDQVEILSNGMYKSVLHRVIAIKEGNRLSIATFYNPGGDAVISPAYKLLYPESFTFNDYLQLYAKTKFAEKGPRFQYMKEEFGSKSGRA